MAHAILAPSSASRWLACTPSARLELDFPDKAGKAAAEGSLAHAISELLIKHKLKRIKPVQYKRELELHKKHELYEPAMLGYCEDYAVFVIERYNEAQQHTSDAILLTEEKVDLTHLVPEGFGTVDNQIIADGVMEIIDLKYGKGVEVSAEHNKQMMLYALGTLLQQDYIYDIKQVRMTIYQPRMENFSSFEMSVEDLKAWGETELKPKAAIAFKGEGEFVPGKHCQFCRARAVCRTNAAHQLELAGHDFLEPVLLDDADVSDILTKAKDFEGWLTAVKEYALAQALGGKKWPGFKLVEGRSNRVYTDQSKVADALLKAGFAEDLIYKKELLGITAMEGEITKKKFSELLGDLVIKPSGKPTLVTQDDKRPELNSIDSAERDFANV
jgi:hypothetical protein